MSTVHRYDTGGSSTLPSAFVDRASKTCSPSDSVDDGLNRSVHAAHAPPSRRHCVDDALTVRELERSILERAGYEVSVASDGMEALARLEGGAIDLVLTDVEMPRMDGFALTRAIRGRPDLANLPVLIVTTLDSAEHRQEGLDSGADAYIVKSSFDERSLLDAVTRALGGPT